MNDKPYILLHGDCLELLKTIPDASVDCVIADPPYGHNNNNNGDLLNRREAALGKKGKAETAKARPILNDGKKEAWNLFECIVREAARILKKNGACCCCCGGGGPDPMFARWSLMMDKHLAFDQMVVWDKGKMGMGWKYRRSYETVLVGHRRGGTLAWFDKTHKVENIIRDVRKIIPDERQHPTLKPVALMERFVRLHCPPGGTVLDPCMGSGTTGVACARAGRRFIGMELDPRWFAAAAARVAKEFKDAHIPETRQNAFCGAGMPHPSPCASGARGAKCNGSPSNCNGVPPRPAPQPPRKPPERT